MTMGFGFVWAFVLLLIPAALIVYRRLFESRRIAPVRSAGSELWAKVRPSWRVRLRWLPFALRVLVLTLLVIAIARPQTGRTYEVTEGEGIDIVIALDLSSSMAAKDFAPYNRLDIAKVTIDRFITGRQVDRIGLVLFAAKAFTQTPLTLDYGMIRQFLQRANFKMIEDGTAIGTALVTATNRLRDSDAKSKVVILLTDGNNNSGRVDPITAAKLAKAIGVRVHTIGIGKQGVSYVPVDDPVLGRRMVSSSQHQLDEETLKTIATTTGGKYFRATDPEKLHEVFDDIDQMERSPYEIKTFTDYTQRYAIVLLAALAALTLEILLSRTAFRSLA